MLAWPGTAQKGWANLCCISESSTECRWAQTFNPGRV
jgi:hypothetical protein